MYLQDAMVTSWFDLSALLLKALSLASLTHALKHVTLKFRTVRVRALIHVGMICADMHSRRDVVNMHVISGNLTVPYACIYDMAGEVSYHYCCLH